MSWYSKVKTFTDDVHKDLKRKRKWEDKYFKFRPRDRVLYIEIGFSNVGGHTYTEEYEGVILCMNKYQIQFRITKYTNHLDPYKIPPEIKVEDEIIPSQNWRCQNILLNKSDFQCLNTDTAIVKDIFVSHLRRSLDPQAYWILAKQTFMTAYIGLEFQKKKCKYGRKCYNIDIDHLVRWRHS